MDGVVCPTRQRMSCPALPDAIWMKILMEEAKQMRINWWNLSDKDKEEEEFHEWPWTDEEMAERQFAGLFRRQPYEAS